MSQRVAELSHRVSADPWDADAWAALCAEATAALPYRDAAPHLSRAAERFPTSAAVWAAYLDAASSPAAQLPAKDVRDILQRAVRAAPTAHDLWRRYAKWAEAHAEVADPVAVYEDALRAAGLDLTAHPLWTDYIDFVKRSELPESNKRDALRKLYQRAVMSPNPSLLPSQRPSCACLSTHINSAAAWSGAALRVSRIKLYRGKLSHPSSPTGFGRGLCIRWRPLEARAQSGGCWLRCVGSTTAITVQLLLLYLKRNMTFCLTSITFLVASVFATLYTRAARVTQVRNPMQDVDKFWLLYRNFEETTNANKDLGRGLIADMQPRHVAARAEYRARRTRREGLALAVLPVPPRGRPKEASQAAQWRRFIAAERANPHGLDAQSLHARVVHAFETALAPLYRYPDIWIDYVSYIADTASGRAISPNLPSSSGGKSGTGGGSAQSAAASNAGQGGGGGSGHASASGTGGAQGITGENAGGGDGNPASVAEFEAVAERAVVALPECVALSQHISWLWMRLGNSTKALATVDALVRASPTPLAYIHFMRLTRKVSGTAAARKVFAKARRDPLAADPAVFVAAAQMEFIVNKDNKVARNVFEFGLKHYGTNAVMVREFLEWLWGLGDFDHLRVVLKRVMPSIEGPPDVVQKLWERWIELEELVGDVASVESVENQWRESGTSRAQTVVSEAVRRSRFLDLEGMRDEELVIAGSSATSAGITAGGTPTGSAGGALSAMGGASAGGGGRRDPRTGRRVGGSGAHATAGSTGSSGEMHGTNLAGSAGATGSFTTGAELLSGNSFEEIAANLRRMGSQMQHISAPPPDYDTIVQLVMKTPDSFSATPAYGALSANGVTPSGAAGKKRSNEDMVNSVTGPTGQIQGQQRPDLFRSRQAAKQSRIR
jgi:hypothetical protein